MPRTDRPPLSEPAALGIFLGFLVFFCAAMIGWANLPHYSAAYGFFSTQAAVYALGTLGGLGVAAGCVLRLFRRRRAAVRAHVYALPFFLTALGMQFGGKDGFYVWWLALAALDLLAAWLASVPDAFRTGPAQARRMVPAIVVGSLFLLVNAAIVIGIILWDPSNAEFPYAGLFFANAALNTVIFGIATARLYFGKGAAGTAFLITGGILAFPLGLVAVGYAVAARRKARRSEETPGKQRDPSAEDRVEEAMGRASRCIDAGDPAEALRLYEETRLAFPDSPRGPEIEAAMERLRERMEPAGRRL